MKKIEKRGKIANYLREVLDSGGKPAIVTERVWRVAHRNGDHGYFSECFWGGPFVRVDAEGYRLNWQSGGVCEDATAEEVAEDMAAAFADAARLLNKEETP